MAECTTFYRNVKRIKRREWAARVINVFILTCFVVFSTICIGRNQNIGMSQSIKRSTTSIRSLGLTLLLTAAMLQLRSLISSNVLRWSRLDISIKRLRDSFGLLRVMTRRTKPIQIGMSSLEGSSLEWRN
jgi:hypothetical protein